MRIERRFTKDGQSPYAGIASRMAVSENSQSRRLGRVPHGHRGAGGVVPGRVRRPRPEIFPQGRRARAPEEGRGGDVPSWLWRSVADEEALAAPPGERALRRRDHSANRCSTASPAPGPIGAGRAAISTTEDDARAFYDEIASCWRRRWRRRTRRNGSTPACTGPTASTARARAITTSIRRPASSTKSTSAYEHPQPHACFIQSVEDDLVNEGGIMDLWVREARLFKYGSGTGTNFSPLRGEGEKLSGGGKSSGLMSFLKIGDRAAGAIKSGGTTRRAAKMVIVDVDHPDIETLHRLEGDGGAEGRGAGRRLQAQPEAPQGGHEGLRQLRRPGRRLLRSRRRTRRCKREIKAARRSRWSPDNYIQRVIQFAKQGYKDIDFDDLRHRLGFRSLSHRLRPELEQLGARHRRLPARGRERTATGT